MEDRYLQAKQLHDRIIESMPDLSAYQWQYCVVLDESIEIPPYLAIYLPQPVKE